MGFAPCSCKAKGNYSRTVFAFSVFVCSFFLFVCTAFNFFSFAFVFILLFVCLHFVCQVCLFLLYCWLVFLCSVSSCFAVPFCCCLAILCSGCSVLFCADILCFLLVLMFVVGLLFFYKIDSVACLFAWFFVCCFYFVFLAINDAAVCFAVSYYVVVVLMFLFFFFFFCVCVFCACRFICLHYKNKFARVVCVHAPELFSCLCTTRLFLFFLM